MITSVNRWTGTYGTGIVNSLPPDFDEAMQEVNEHAASNGDSVEFLITPNLLHRAYSFLYSEFSDQDSREELQKLTVAQVIEWYLDL